MIELRPETVDDWWEVEALFDLCFAPGREALSSYRLRDGIPPVAGLSKVARDEQAILFLNRRGFATTIQCPACGHVVSCPDCDMPLTHHRDGGKAVCHYCDYTIATLVAPSALKSQDD